MEITIELYYIQNALYSIGYSVDEVNSLITLMYKCRTFGVYMENELSLTNYQIPLYDMYLCQRDEIDALIPFLESTLYPFGPGPGEQDALAYAGYDLLYENTILIYTTT
jgi:hypothetical protein